MATIWLYHNINIVTVTIYIENRFAINIENNLPFPSSKNNNTAKIRFSYNHIKNVVILLYIHYNIVFYHP